jgi:hypothetical protein
MLWYPLNMWKWFLKCCMFACMVEFLQPEYMDVSFLHSVSKSLSIMVSAKDVTQ